MSVQPLEIPPQSVSCKEELQFKSSKDYNVLFAEHGGARSAAQIKAFHDTWRWDDGAARVYAEVVEAGGRVSQVLQAFRGFIPDSDMLAYLSMMAPRLVELRRVLKETGTIYLHCDPTASHYLKILMDAVFGVKYFLNEIVWCYETGGRSKSHFPRKHDTIFRYGKSQQAPFYYNQVALPRDFSTMHETVQVDETGRRFQRNVKAGKEYRYYEDQGVLPNDWWADIQLNPAAKERLGYPTQKPEALLERIISASTLEGGTILDPFCGCGTAIAVAERLNRRWIGIDITHLAITLIKHRLSDTFGATATYGVIGEPVSLPDAKVLAEQDPYQFQWWALGLLGARPTEQKKGADRGIDGRRYFHDEGLDRQTKQIVFSVKGGNVTVSQVRDLRGVVEREKAAIGGFISIQEPTEPMRREAASAGFYESFTHKKYPRIQLLTIAQILGGKGLECPALAEVNVTFKKAPRVFTAEPEQLQLTDAMPHVAEVEEPPPTVRAQRRQVSTGRPSRTRPRRRPGR